MNSAKSRHEGPETGSADSFAAAIHRTAIRTILPLLPTAQPAFPSGAKATT